MRPLRTVRGALGSRGRRSVLFNLAGAAAPALLALLAIPRVAAALGPPRFGVLALAWAALGYAGLLHLGLGRALARSTAAGDARPAEEVAGVAWTVVALTTGLGVLAGLAGYAAAPWLAGRVLHLAGPLRDEATAALRVLCLAAPFSVGAPALGAVLEARFRFDLVNAVVVAVSAVTYGGPLLAVLLGAGLVPVVAALVAARVLAWGAYLWLCVRVMPELAGRPRLRPGELGPLLRFGGWTTLSSVASPLMVYMDRFVVGALLSVAATAYYATPQEVVLRMGVLSGAVAGFLFPAFAAAGEGKREHALMRTGVDATAALVVPITLLAGILAAPLLTSWMGPDYGRRGGAALAWLAVGLLVNGLAKVPSALLQGVGRPDLTARLHLLELPVFAAVLVVLVRMRGVEGAAISWLLRVTADAVALFWLAARRDPRHAGAAWRALAVVAAAGAAVVAGRLLPPVPAALFAVAAAASAAWAGLRVLRRPPVKAPAAAAVP